MKKGSGRGGLARAERLQIMLSTEELHAVDTFRFDHRIPSRAGAVRELFRLGIAAAGAVVDTAGIKVERRRRAQNKSNKTAIKG